MKKKSSGILLIVILSIIINIDYVKGESISMDGTSWEKVCKYNSGEHSIQLYSKSGTTMIIDSRFGSNSKIYYKQPVTLSNGKKYLVQNNVLVSDGKCPTIIYAYIDGKGIVSVGIFDKRGIIYATASQKHWYDGDLITGNTEEVYIRESSDNELPNVDPSGETTCDEIIDESLKSLINKYLGYVHILIPIVILALGVFDFFRAMISSTEDEMKKAQKNFVIRLVSGVLIFLAPTIVNIIIDVLNVGACLIE